MHILPDDDSLDVKTGKHLIQWSTLALIWRSIHKEELSRICVGSFIISCCPNCDAIFPKALPWEVVLSLIYWLFYFPLTSLIITTRKEIFWDKVPKFSSRLSENFSNLFWVWLGDLLRATKLESLSPIFNLKFMHSCRYWMSRTCNGKKLL